MASEMAVDSEAPEWRVTVPEQLSARPVPEKVQAMSCSQLWKYVKKASDWKCRHSRQVLYCLKLGLAVSLVSLSFYVRPLYQGFSGSAIGAILTATSIFDMHVGGTLYKGFTESTANFLAAGLALGVHFLANQSGEKAEPIVRMVSVFLLAFAATWARYFQRIKNLFEDGMMTFIIIFILFLVSGYRDDNMIVMAYQRIYAVTIGSSVGALVCILFCPVWAGNELHLTLTQNMEKLANSFDGCVAEFFKGSRKLGSDEKTHDDIEGYKSILDSKGSEDSLVQWARWEPPHGRFSLRHPWRQYLNVGAEVRCCASSIEALHGCISSEIQASEFMGEISGVCLRLCTLSSKVLKELAVSMKYMKRSLTIDILVIEMDFVAKELQTALKSLSNLATIPSEGLEQDEKSQSISTNFDPALKDIVLFINFTSHLIKCSSRIKSLINSLDNLAHIARFKPVKNYSQNLIVPEEMPPLEPEEQETKIILQQSTVPDPSLKKA